MATTYLTTKIVQSKHVPSQPRLDSLGYTVKAGSPTDLMVKLEGESIWRRLMAWQFSNAGTLFVRIKGTAYIVDGFSIPR